MNVSKLKALYEAHQASIGKPANYFDRGTMRFFGDTMRNFKVEKVTAWNWYDECEVEGYQLVRKTTTWKGAPCGDLAFFGLNGEVIPCVVRNKGDRG